MNIIRIDRRRQTDCLINPYWRDTREIDIIIKIILMIIIIILIVEGVWVCKSLNVFATVIEMLHQSIAGVGLTAKNSRFDTCWVR